MSEKKNDFLVSLPSMGEGVQEATLNKWLKKQGDEVKKDEPLLEVSTDKVDTEIMSPHSGYLIATFAESEKTIAVGEQIAQISLKKNAEVIKLESQKESSQAPQTQKRKAPGKDFSSFQPGSFAPRQVSEGTYAGPVKASPLVKKMALDFGVSLSDVAGTGEYGRVTKDDLLFYMKENSSQNREVSSTHTEPKKLPVEQKDGKEFLEGVEIKREPMSKIRRLTADHMLHSVKTSPHVTTTFEINLDPVLAYKKENSESFHKKHGIKLTLTPFFVFACAKALKEHPHANASVDGHDILLKEDINIACAVATDNGLMVPAMKKLQGLSFPEVVSKFQNLVTKTREKKLEPSDLAGGTFSITNPGMYGSLHSQPIINQPQVAILSVGALTQKLALEEEILTSQTVCQIGLTFDHRIIDGQGGAFFLQTVKKELEEWNHS